MEVDTDLPMASVDSHRLGSPAHRFYEELLGSPRPLGIVDREMGAMDSDVDAPALVLDDDSQSLKLRRRLRLGNVFHQTIEAEI